MNGHHLFQKWPPKRSQGRKSLKAAEEFQARPHMSSNYWVKRVTKLLYTCGIFTLVFLTWPIVCPANSFFAKNKGFLKRDSAVFTDHFHAAAFLWSEMLNFRGLKEGYFWKGNLFRTCPFLHFDLGKLNWARDLRTSQQTYAHNFLNKLPFSFKNIHFIR